MKRSLLLGISILVLAVSGYVVNNFYSQKITANAEEVFDPLAGLDNSPAYQLKLKYHAELAYKFSDERKTKKLLNETNEAEYFNKLRANPTTGKIEIEEVLEARRIAIERMQNKPHTRADITDLTWSAQGPDNIGGRTRAIIFDNVDHNKMFSLGVTGGLFFSTDGGNSWAAHQIQKDLDFQGGSAMVQASNGDIYVGTGESFVYTSDNQDGHIGGGIWKSSDRGATFTRLQATVPDPLFNASQAWAYVNELAADPNNPNKIWASIGNPGRAGGLYYTLDGGDNWTQIGASNGLNTTDINRYSWEVVVTNNDIIHANINEKYYRSGDNGNSFQLISVSSGFPSTSQWSRVEFAVSPQNNNYVYGLFSRNGSTLGVYRSTNSGLAWEEYSPINSPSFNPLGTQGDYDLTIAVDPTNKDRVVVGGQVELWMGGMTQGVGWNMVALSYGGSPSNPYYVHADMHRIIFHPTDPKTMFVAGDGGLYMTNNADQQFPTFVSRNKGYAVTQYYHIDANQFGEMIGGAQDNGTTFMDGKGNTVEAGDFVSGGDGADCALSRINNNAMYASSQWGSVRFSSNKGESFTSIWDCFINPGQAVAPFISTYYLWETPEANNKDYVEQGDEEYYNDMFINYYNTVDSDTVTYAVGTEPDSVINDTVTFVIVDTFSTAPLDSFYVYPNYEVPTDSAANALGEPKYYPPCSKAEAVRFYIDTVEYKDSTIIDIDSSIVDIDSIFNPIDTSWTHTDTTWGNYDTIYDYNFRNYVRFQDSHMSKKLEALMLFGFNSGRVGVTPNPLDFSNGPRWFRLDVGGAAVMSIAASDDGKHFYYGTSGGHVWRIDGLRTADFSGCMAANNCTGEERALNPTEMAKLGIKATRVFQSGGRYVAGIAVNPNDPGDVIITLAQYGRSDHVYRDTAADVRTTNVSNTGTFKNITGDLAPMPVYSAVVDYYNPANIVIGTELGVWATSNGFDTNPNWVSVNTGMPPVPTFEMRQKVLYEEGCRVIYAGCYARGAFRTVSLMPETCDTFPHGHVGIVENPEIKALNLYPNPVIDKAFIELDVTETTPVNIFIFDIMGRTFENNDLGTVSPGLHKFELDFSHFSNGIYIVNVKTKDGLATRKVIVQH